MNKKTYIIAGVVLVLLCAIGICAMGRTMKIRTNVAADQAVDYNIQTDFGDSVIRVVDQGIENGFLTVTVEAVSRGKDFLTVLDGEKMVWANLVYVHHFGVITQQTYFGMCSGVWLIPAAIILYLALLLFGMIRTYRSDVEENLYQYRNVTSLGLVVYLGFLLLDHLLMGARFSGIDDSIRELLNSAKGFALLSLPVAFIISLIMTVSNIKLMMKEGRTWRNMLGTILGILICLGIIFPFILGEWLQRATIVDVHNERGIALYVELFVEALVSAAVAYLECVLVGTVVLGFKAARRMPSFDKDYILIHGCQIRKDGTLTNLLKGRADRAVEFARMQKDAAGKDIVFVPSGGQGSDEVITEAAAISNYLKSIGIPEKQILLEDKSVNTYENLRNAAKLIEARGGGNVAFSTTNYHVLRTGLLATALGLRYEGIGSPTKSYFWINAFIREFIATLYSERKSHLRTVAILTVLILLMVGMMYVSNNF